jgi:serpin B
MKKTKIILASVLLGLGLVSCEKAAELPIESPVTSDPPLTSSQMVNSNNTFALDIYKKVVDEDQNQILSPYSISTALAMTYAGADGNTATQMQSVFGFGANNNTFHTDFNQTKTNIENNINSSPNNQIKILNKIWRNSTYSFLPSFETTMNNTYGAPVVATNFSQPTAARQQINNWVEQETNQLIKDFLPVGFIQSNTATVLVNALYLSADWEHPFDTNRTTLTPFATSSGNMTNVKMMEQEIACNNLRFMEDSQAEVLELYLKDKKAAVTFILPKSTTIGINSFVQNMTGSQLDGWLNGLTVPNFPGQNFKVKLPKFDFETILSVKSPLQQLGMTDAFTSAVNLSKMGPGNLEISDVQHHTAVKFFESGIEAAAATAVGIFVTSTPPIARTVELNRPFLVLIREVETGGILFMGHVQQP